MPQRERSEPGMFYNTCMVEHYSLQWVMTDARHDSTSNAYHTKVACLSYILETLSLLPINHTFTHRISKVVGI